MKSPIVFTPNPMKPENQLKTIHNESEKTQISKENSRAPPTFKIEPTALTSLKDINETANVISKSKFYSPSVSKPAMSQSDSENRINRILNDLKCLDNKPLIRIPQLSNKRNREDSENEKLTAVVTTPKRNRTLNYNLESMCKNYDQENQENKATTAGISFKRWNRSSSVTSFGKG